MKEKEKLIALLNDEINQDKQRAIALHKEIRLLKQDNEKVRSLNITEPFVDEILYQMAKSVGRKIVAESPELRWYVRTAIEFVCRELQQNNSYVQVHYMPDTIRYWLRDNWLGDKVVVFRLDPISITTNLPGGRMQEHLSKQDVAIMTELLGVGHENSVTTIRLP